MTTAIFTTASGANRVDDSLVVVMNGAGGTRSVDDPVPPSAP